MNTWGYRPELYSVLRGRDAQPCAQQYCPKRLDTNSQPNTVPKM